MAFCHGATKLHTLGMQGCLAGHRMHSNSSRPTPQRQPYPRSSCVLPFAAAWLTRRSAWPTPRSAQLLDVWQSCRWPPPVAPWQTRWHRWRKGQQRKSSSLPLPGWCRCYFPRPLAPLLLPLPLLLLLIRPPPREPTLAATTADAAAHWASAGWVVLGRPPAL